MSWKHACAGALCVAALFAAHELGRARADGIPRTTPLYFSGTLEADGAPVTGTRPITLRLFDDASAGTELCRTTSPSVPVERGEFRVALDGACLAAVQANSEVWVEAEVGGVRLDPRVKIGAVPYAVESARASELAPRGREALVPAGTVIAFAGSAAPRGWLLCDGRAVSRAEYAALFAAIGTTYGAGDGSSTFALPDLRGRAAVGAGAGAGLSERRLGQRFGEESHALSDAEMPRHTHAVVDPGHAHGVTDPGHRHDFQIGTNGSFRATQFLLDNTTFSDRSVATVTESVQVQTTGVRVATSPTGLTLASAGQSEAHNVVQPSLALHYLIRH